MVTNHIGPDAVIRGLVIQTSTDTTVRGARGAVVNSVTGNARISGTVIQAGVLNNLDLRDDENAAPGTGPQAR
ncbi:hypothetical protein ACWGKU_29430 [Kitasatospora sp. NPDC054768]